MRDGTKGGGWLWQVLELEGKLQEVKSQLQEAQGSLVPLQVERER